MLLYFFVYFFLAATANHNNPVNNSSSDVVVTYGGHADAVQPVEVVKEYPDMTSAQPVIKEISESPAPEQPNPQPPKPCLKSSGCGDTTEPNSLQPSDHLVTESVDMVFIPNEHVSDDSAEFLNSGRNGNNYGDVMEGRYRISDIVSGRALENAEPSIRPEVVFVTGKNFENAEDSREHPTRRHQKHQEGDRTKEKTPPKKKVDCKKLDCSNKIKSVCGGKVENVNKWKYRLFLNQCYLDKVNCDFKFEYNKYTVVPREKCDRTAAHYTRRPHVYIPRPPSPKKVPPVDEVARRSMSRRATNMDANGQYCSHPCPTSCPSDYNPECGVSASGQKRVFLNHCKLDYNSCSFRIVWFRRPLSECVGQEAVDLKQNRPFISWMQHVGIIDARGRFVRE